MIKITIITMVKKMMTIVIINGRIIIIEEARASLRTCLLRILFINSFNTLVKRNTIPKKQKNDFTKID